MVSHTIPWALYQIRTTGITRTGTKTGDVQSVDDICPQYRSWISLGSQTERQAPENLLEAQDKRVSNPLTI